MPTAELDILQSTSFRAMASTWTVSLDRSDGRNRMLVDQVVAAVRAVERACSRFDPSAELARWNRSVEPFVASDLLVEVLDAAMWGFASTDGRFDPRVHDALCALGYDRTFAAVRERTAIPPSVALPESFPHPVIGRGARLLAPQEFPLDLGGIAKGYALAMAGELLSAHGVLGVVNAGGDVVVIGDAVPMPIGIEDPHCEGELVAVVHCEGGAIMTSSIRVRSWTAAGMPVHHLIDPRTGRPGGTGLSAVTVVGAQPVDCEVWSKALFLNGADGITAEAEDRGLAVLWVTSSGRVCWSSALVPSLSWVAT